MNRFIVFFVLAFSAVQCAALPQRLVIALDGIAYRDMKALQAGVTETNVWGGIVQLQAFTTAEGYFPVSRLVSTFPSTSDVAWTDIFGDRPLPGYQRTYFSEAANAEVTVNGLTSTVEHERQMDWQTAGNFARAMGYIYSVHTFNYELREMSLKFFDRDNTNADFYVYIRSSDDAQHMDRDILVLLSSLDRRLQDLRARYKAQTGHDLQILILSDHGHNHAGRGERIPVRAYLEKSGYHITQSICGPQDVVLPTSGIEDWIEVHNTPAETEKLAETLTHLKGVDVLAARLPDQPNEFLVLNSRGERAFIRWRPEKNEYQYSPATGDPLHYQPALVSLAQKKELDADGFATADDWMSLTITNHYPLALQRIVRGLTCVTLNPATILVSLDNHYVNDGWLVDAGSQLETCGSTHGALDDINSLGIVLSNFTPTHDTSTDRVAGLFDNFPGLRNYRDEENGAEWVLKKEQAMTRIPRDPFDWNYQTLPDDEVFLRVWSPQLAGREDGAPLDAMIEKMSDDAGDPPAKEDPPKFGQEIHLTFAQPVSFSKKFAGERIYTCPANLTLAPETEYRISGWLENNGRFELYFRTDSRGRPVAY